MGVEAHISFCYSCRYIVLPLSSGSVPSLKSFVKDMPLWSFVKASCQANPKAHHLARWAATRMFHGIVPFHLLPPLLMNIF